MGIQQMFLGVGGVDTYLVDNSLKFDPDNSSYLNKTPSGPGNRRTFTLSYWIKECGKGSSPYNNPHILWSGTGSDTRGGFVHRGTGTNAGKLYLFNQVSTSTNCQVWTSALTEDNTVWRHMVLSVDTTQATSTDRVKIYINGVQESLTFSTTPAQNLELQININQEHRIGRGTPDDYGNGYLADLHFVDGTALDASSFGETVGGSWVAKEYTHSTSDWHTVNDGTNWTSSAVSGVSGWTQALAQGFNGSLSNAAEGNTNGETATIALGQDITISAGGVGVYTWVTSGAPLVFELKLDGVVKETINQGASGGQWYYSSSYAGDIDSITVARTGRAPEWGAISINGVVLVDGAADNSFHLKFENTSNKGEDSAGSNDWTANNFDGTSIGAYSRSCW